MEVGILGIGGEPLLVQLLDACVVVSHSFGEEKRVEREKKPKSIDKKNIQR